MTTMQMIVVLLGVGLVIVGVFFALGGKGMTGTGAKALKQFELQAPAWVLMIAMGIGLVVFASVYDWTENTPQPPGIEEPIVGVDVEELNALWIACAEGDGFACDDLYWISPIGSEYELFGATCGGRYEWGEVESCFDLVLE